MKPLTVTHLTRRPAPGAFSIERVFADIRAALPEAVVVKEAMNSHISQGVLPRLKDAWAARHHRAQVNHITGDVHYLSYFLPRRSTVLTIHDTVLVDRERGGKRWLLWFFWFWLPARRVGWITAISEESKRRILALIDYDPDRIEVIPDPVSPDFIPRPLPPRSGPFRLLHVGTKAHKNLQRLIPALAGLDIELTVIGHLNVDQLELPAEHRIVYRTLKDLSDAEIRDEYARAEALVFVTLDEGFGLPIVEAQATGRPVITSARAPMDWVSGGAALLVDPEDQDAIRAAVVQLTTEPELRDRLVANGLENVARFSAKTIAAHYTALYRRIAEVA